MVRHPVPACLLTYAAAPAWVAWNIVRTGARALKVPYDPRTGRAASVSNAATWGTLEAARRLAVARAYRGVGIVSAGVPALVFLDLDRCVNVATGEPTNDDAIRLLETCANTYAERTPSGAGLRIIGTAPDIAAGISRNGTTPGGLALEAYKAAARYLTVTGSLCGGHPDCLSDIGDAVLDLLPVLGNATFAPDTAGEGRVDGELVRRIVTGEGFHAELCALAARYLGRGMSDEAAAETLRGLMQAHPEAARDERWRDRFASIAGLVTSASRKYAALAPDRRNLARLTFRMLRDKCSATEVRGAVLAEAEVLGIDPTCAEGILTWAGRQELARRGMSHG